MNKKYAVFLILAVVFSGMFLRYMHRVPKRHYCDFRVYYATGQRFIERQNIYSRPDEAITPFKYSPMFALVISPLSFFSIKTASLIFFTFNYLALITAFILSAKIIVKQPLPSRKNILLYLIPAVFSFRFILQTLDSGQVNIIMFLAVLGGLYCLQKAQEPAGTALLAFSIMFKYMPAVFLPYFLVRKKIKFIGLIALFSLIFCFLPAIYTGVEKAMVYLRNWLPFITETSLDSGSWCDFKNQSLYSFILRYFTTGSPYGISLVDLTFAQAMTIAISLGSALYFLILIPGKKRISPFP